MAIMVGYAGVSPVVRQGLGALWQELRVAGPRDDEQGALLRLASPRPGGEGGRAVGDTTVWVGYNPGADFVGHLDAEAQGVFACAHHDRDAGTLTLRCDRYGLGPLFVLRLQRGVLFANRADLLLRHSPEPLHFDRRGAAQYLDLSYCLGDRTFAEEIRRVPQGVDVVVDTTSGAVREITTFAYGELPEPSIGSMGAAVEALRGPLVDAVARHGPDGAVLPLSGGYDSRAIAIASAALGRRPQTVTTEGDTSSLADVDAAALLAEELGFDNTYVPIPDDYMATYWRQKNLLTDFGCSMHSWMLPLVRSGAFVGATVLDGLGGDTTIQAWERWVDPRADRAAAHIAQQHTRHLRARDGLIPEVGKAWHDQAWSDVAADMEPYAEHPYAHTFFALRNRTRRGIAVAPMHLLTQKWAVRFPFFDHRLFEACMAIEHPLKDKRRLYEELLRTLNPSAFAVPSCYNDPWPKETPMRKQVIRWIRSPEGLLSYLDVIEQEERLMPDLLRPGWLNTTREAVMGGRQPRRELGRTIFVLGDLADWAVTYGDRVRF